MYEYNVDFDANDENLEDNMPIKYNLEPNSTKQKIFNMKFKVWKCQMKKYTIWKILKVPKNDKLNFEMKNYAILEKLKYKHWKMEKIKFWIKMAE